MPPVLRYRDPTTGRWMGLGGSAREVHVGPNPPSGEMLWVDTDETYDGFQLQAHELTGPWSPTFVTVNLPFKCDVLINWSASWYAPVVGYSGVRLYHSGNYEPMWASHWFSEANSHRESCATALLLGVSGSHSLGVGHASNATSDGADHAHLGLTIWRCP